MSLGNSLYEACRVVREGGWVDTTGLSEQVSRQHQTLSARLMGLPSGLDRLSELVDLAFGDYAEAVAGLRLACSEEAPELAHFAMQKSLDGHDTMRRLKQLLEEYSQALCEEADNGDF